MKHASELRVGEVIKSPLYGRDAKGQLVREKKGPPRTVVRVKPRTGLTYVETVHAHNPNAREVWELLSDEQVVV